MELFNLYYNSDIQFLLDLFSLKQPFSVDAGLALAKANHVYAEYGSHRAALNKWIACGVLEEAGEGQLRVAKGKGLRPFAAPPNQLEMEALSDICGTPEAEWFLSADARPEGAGSRETLFDYVWRQNPAGRRQELRRVRPEVFQTLLRAIYERREIEMDYCTKEDPSIRRSSVIPYRMECGVFDGRWWLISYRAKEDRAIKSTLANLKAVRLGEKHTVQEAQIRSAIMRNLVKEPVILRVRNQKNGLERCFLTFENMLDMTACRRNDLEYELRFRCFRWDRNVIIRRLLYLGECVSLVSPDAMKQELIAALRSAVRLRSAMPPGECVPPAGGE